jgi:hypothetical protein
LSAPVAVGALLGFLLYHEFLHVLINFIETGTLASCQFWPISEVEYRFLSTQTHACVDQSSGLNALLTTTITSVTGIAVLIYSRDIMNSSVRWGIQLAAGWNWIHQAFYSMGVLRAPYVQDGQVMSGTGDGYLVIQEFGQLGMIPGAVLLAVGAVIVWETVIKDSPEACSCQTIELP